MKFKKFLSVVIATATMTMSLFSLPIAFADNGKSIDFNFKPISSTDSHASISKNTITISFDDISKDDIIVTIGGFFGTYTSPNYDFGGFDMQFKASNNSFVFVNEWNDDKDNVGKMSSVKGPATQQSSATYTLSDGRTFTTTAFPTCFGQIKTLESNKTEYLSHNLDLYSNNIGTDNIAKIIASSGSKFYCNIPELPLYSIDLRIPSGTPSGIYTIDIDESVHNDIYEHSCQNYNVNWKGAKIIISDDTKATTTTNSNSNKEFSYTDDQGIVYYIFSDHAEITGVKNSTNIEYIKIPTKIQNVPITEVFPGAFNYCSKLKRIEVDENNMYLSSENGILFNKNKTELIRYPIGKTDTDYSIPNSVTKIGISAFESSELTNIVIPSSVKMIEKRAYMYCCKLTSINLPNSITSIGTNAFSYCGIEKIVIPSSVNEIGIVAFTGCENLLNIDVDPNNTIYSSQDGVLFDKYKKIIIAYPYGRNGDYIIPNNIETIEYGAFWSCNISNITIPNSVIKICSWAFYNSNIKDVYYNGNKEQWQNITISSENDNLKNANMHYSNSTITTTTYSQNNSPAFVDYGVETIGMTKYGLFPGESCYLIINGKSTQNIDESELKHYSFHSSNPAVAKIDSNGKITAISKGNAEVTASAMLGTKTISVFVLDSETTTVITTTNTINSSSISSQTITTTSNFNIATTISTTELSQFDFKWENDNFSFSNDKQYFNDKYNISDSLKQQLSEKSSNLGWDNINELLESPWKGSCFGMAAVEILVKSGKLNPILLDNNYNNLYKVSAPIINNQSESYINYYHVLQKNDVIQTKAQKYLKRTNKSRINDIINMTLKINETKIPILICFNYTKTASERLKGGHAIVAYGIEYGTWTYLTKYNCRILISDPNSTNFKDEMCIYINTHTYEWEIPYYQEKYYSCSNKNQNTRDTHMHKYGLQQMI